MSIDKKNYFQQSMYGQMRANVFDVWANEQMFSAICKFLCLEKHTSVGRKSNRHSVRWTDERDVRMEDVGDKTDIRSCE